MKSTKLGTDEPAAHRPSSKIFIAAFKSRNKCVAVWAFPFSLVAT